MPTLHDVHNWNDIAVMGAWTLLVIGVARVVFQSYLAEVARAWLINRKNRLPEVQILRSEINTRKAYDARSIQGDQMRLPPLLTDAEVNDRRKRYNELVRETRMQRFVLYPLRCAFCQHVQVAFALLVFSRMECAILSAIAYGTLATLIAGHASGQPRPTPHAGGCGAKR